MGQEELAGPAVILAHRLMKNTASEKTGLRAYAMFTQAALEAMQIPEMEFSLLCTDWIKENSNGSSQVIFSIGAPQADDAQTQAQIDRMWPALKAELIQHVEGHAGTAYAKILAERGY